MWIHYCKYEKSNMTIAKGCACNWCMAKELGVNPDKLRARRKYGWSIERMLSEGNTPTPADVTP